MVAWVKLLVNKARVGKQSKPVSLSLRLSFLLLGTFTGIELISRNLVHLQCTRAFLQALLIFNAQCNIYMAYM